ncbi:6-pyruvoyltetrahydropterin/6-carboxytetrahydropterin synthase [Kitasatospora sp. GP30]|uniref:6-pyruvoyl trahydropterin synthase family protein n=1 Tax=Kitasatospora sp. GP30 TaxID=3035084 RepID=UPI000CBDCDB7|nr:6-carboxytetrahydropterin synthase [Kitasatospora sp. GP30]MDH6144145.1 6-pyruvoyltetrahydropterin/6-carboxytetrahydropterin synthase [Kitasatospora sp. GP30]
MSAVIGEHRIGKQFRFEAAHYLPGLPEGHQCGRLHGHSYTVEFVLTADRLTGPGFVADFGDLAPVKKMIDSTLDHQVLNEVLPEVVPTSENLAAHLAGWFVEHVEPGLPGRLVSVRVSETATSWAQFEVAR